MSTTKSSADNGGKTTICILYGGKSGEHEISLRSAASIVKNLKEEFYETILVGIDREGRWHLQEKASIVKIENQGESLLLEKTGKKVSIVPGEGLFCEGESISVDVVFPILHGSYGEDGTIQGLLEIADIPYIGSGVLGSSLSMDKEKAKKVWRQEGLPVVDFGTIRRHLNEGEAEEIAGKLGFPLFAKPARTGSSLGITKVEDTSGLEDALKEAFIYDSKVILERAITGREIECSVIGNREPVSFPPGEIIPKHSFYDYSAKYTDPEGAQLVIPARISEELSREIQGIAREAYRAVEAEGFSRVDFFVEDKTGKIYINEINTIPGFTSISMFPKLCQAGGMPYPEILDRLIALALEKYREKQEVKYRYQ